MHHKLTQDAEARRIGSRAATELQLIFDTAGFWISAMDAKSTGSRAYVSIAPVDGDVATRLLKRLREWDA